MAPRIADEIWNQHKDEIIALYQAPKREGTLKKTMQTMKDKYGFQATKSQYNTKFDDWGIQKNADRTIWAYADQKTRKRKLVEGKDTGFNIHGRKRTQKEVEREIGRNVTHKSRLQLMEDIPTPEGVEVFTPGAEVPCTTVTFRKACTSNLPSVQLQRQIHALMYKNHPIIKLDLSRTMNDQNSQSLRILDTPDQSSSQLSIRNSSIDADRAMLSNLIQRDVSSKKGISLASYFTPDDSAHGLMLSSYGLEGVGTEIKLLQYFIYLTNNGKVVGSELEKGVKQIIMTLGESLLFELLSCETITMRTFMRKILPVVVADGNIKVTKYILERHSDILNLTNYRPTWQSNTQQEKCMSIAVRNGDSRMVELLCTAGFSPRILFTEPLPFPDRKPLWNAGNIDALETLLTFGADSEFFIVGKPRGYPLIEAAQSGSLDAVNILLKHGSRVNSYVGNYFGTALQAAVWAEDLKMAEYLIACRADINAPFGTQYQLPTPTYSKHYNQQSRWGMMTPVQIACVKNNALLVKLLLRHRANVNLSPLIQYNCEDLQRHLDFCRPEYTYRKNYSRHHSDNPSLTPLQHSVQNGNISLVILLLSSKADPNLRAIPDWEDTPLQLSIRLDYPDIARVLMESGADVNASPGKFNGRTALQAAAESGNIQIALELLRRHADINAPPGFEKGLTTLQAAIIMGHPLMAGFLWTSGANINAPPAPEKGLTAIQAAAEIGDSNLVNDLIRQGADVKNTAAGNKAMLVAITHKNLPMLKLLVQHGAPINEQNDHDEMPPIVAAAKNGWIGGVRYLLDNGADINCYHYSISPLYWSILENHFEMIDYLLMRGASLHCPSAKVPYHDSLCLAINFECHTRTINRLIDEYTKADPFTLDQEVLATAVCDAYGNYDPVTTAIILNAMSKLPKTQYVAQVMNAWNIYSENDEWIYCFNGKDAEPKKQVITFLLKAGANVNSRHPSESLTLLQKSIQLDSIEMAKFLIEKGAEIEVPASRDTGTPLQEAIKNDAIDFTHFLLERGADINAPPAEYYGATALQEATKNGNRRLISILLERGAEVNAPPAEDSGVTALQAAAINGDIDIAIDLIEHGARVAAPGAPKNGRTSIDGAAEHGNEDMLQLLLNHYDGYEDLTVVCGRAANYAEEEGHGEIASWLRKYPSLSTDGE